MFSGAFKKFDVVATTFFMLFYPDVRLYLQILFFEPCVKLLQINVIKNVSAAAGMLAMLL